MEFQVTSSFGKTTVTKFGTVSKWTATDSIVEILYDYIISSFNGGESKERARISEGILEEKLV